MYDAGYLKFIKWCKTKNIEMNLSRTEYLFVTFLLQHKEETNKIGNLERLLPLARDFMRNNPDFALSEEVVDSNQ
jgi:hypothetical protein